MKKGLLLALLPLLNTYVSVQGQTLVAGRMAEVFLRTDLATNLNDPWEIVYGPDGALWITEAKGYTVRRMSNPDVPATPGTVLNLAPGASGYLTAAQHTAFNRQFDLSAHNPQGGMMGLALHPDFAHPTSPKRFVYLAYVHSYDGTAANNAGIFYTNRLVRFTFNTISGKLESPVSLCDTLPGSSDHNSGRLVVAPVNGLPYLFYASGDMGAGQFTNLSRPVHAQDPLSYEGKILRFNLEGDGDAGGLDRWIPNNNPFNAGTQSAVWSTGLRNNQGFAFATIGGVGRLYGGSHGPYSDDEINIIEGGKNYGHPLVVGLSTDGNYNGVKAGKSNGSLPLIVSESTNASNLGTAYREPMFLGYAASPATVSNIYNNDPPNGNWPSEAWSGMEVYEHSAIPGWKSSLIMGSLKWGRVLRLKLNGAGSGIIATAGSDTVSYFGSANRFRDVALAPNGRDVFVVMDRSQASSGPSFASPSVPSCAGCVQKYSFLGYRNKADNRSSIPPGIAVSAGTSNSCTPASAITINAQNNALWVPITGPDGNIVAEIKANGNNLGVVTASFYSHSGAVREDVARQLYLDRSITLTPQVQPVTPVSVRFYFTALELSRLVSAVNSSGAMSGVAGIAGMAIFKNADPCLSSLAGATTKLSPVYAEAHGSDGFVLQANTTSFSTFYFAGAGLTVLPAAPVTLKGRFDRVPVLQWSSPVRQSFVIERSLDGVVFFEIGKVEGRAGDKSFHYEDHEAVRGCGAVFYRLRMGSATGATTYTSTITLASPCPAVTMDLMPHPAADELKVRVSLTSGGPVQVVVRDLLGRVLERQEWQLGRGRTDLLFRTRPWKAGVYSVTLIHRGESISQKFVVRRRE